MDVEVLSFVYRDGRGVISHRLLVGISESDVYLQGYCLKAEALRTFRKDRILQQLKTEEVSDDQMEYYRSISPPPAPPARSHSLLDVCFTGFKKADKERLIELAEQNEVTVRSSVTRKLNYLCCGYNAGPKKIEKARKQNVVIFSEEQFVWLLKTGEMPESCST